MKLLMHEVLQKVSNAKTKAEKIKLLKEFNTQALRSLLIINFDESIISMLPDGEPPFKKNESPDGTDHTVLEKEARILHHFFKGGSSISKTKRETMFIQMLEGLSEGEANVLILAKDKKLGKRWKITKQCVEEAFPQIKWGGRS
jgi:hypothetical protein|tara:strand:- start:6465 stop:6896 length:432 start_codon:yes stop_codon:yes gene_type:complete